MFQNKLFYFLILMLVMIPSVQGLAATNQSTTSLTLNNPDALTLEQCLELAYGNNKTLQKDQENVIVAQDGVRQAIGGFFPTLGYTASSNNSDKKKQTINYDTSESAKEYYAGNLNANLPLDITGKLTANLKIARYKLAYVQESIRKDKQTLTYEVKNDYYQVWLAEKQLEIEQASYDDMDQHFQQIQGFYKAGVKSKYELYLAQVQRDILKPKVLNAQSTLIIYKLQLATRIGISKNREFMVEYDPSKLNLPDGVNLTLDDLMASAYQNRPEIHQYHLNTEMSTAQTKIDAASGKPNLTLTASYNEYSAESEPGTYYPYWLWSLSLSGNIFDGGVVHSKVMQDKETQKLNVISEADLHDQIQLTLNQALQKLNNSIESIQASKSSMDMAQETLQMTKARYNNGMATTMDIIDAENALDTNLDSYYQGVVEYLLALANLDLETGKD
ncbi:MAG TPA: hypothetical protein DDW50_06675 [Firmicutes bacterium]|jgi:outer membrane protein|nr:hypothetical protein [Bacillota bacterium]